MSRQFKTLSPFGFLLIVMLAFAFHGEARAQASLSPEFKKSGEKLAPSVRAGREIWFFATAFNDRFFTYTYPQRLGATIDWYDILGAENRHNLFQRWGAIPNPDCCIPGTEACKGKAESLEETFGFPWCPGDEELLKYVGKQGYKDPACDFEDAPFDASTPHGEKDQRQNACDLKFGTSTGALGLRKFPNPRFDAEKWKQLNGSLASWSKYPDRSKATDASYRTNKLFDAAVEPPFRIGMSCGACHIAYDPLKPPANADNPTWENIKGLIGNQYSRVSQLLGSGLSHNLLEWQLIARARPGIVDTSALPMDTVHNPGTMNTIYNFASRPTFPHQVLKWRKAASCPSGAKEDACWCEPGKPGKCWERSEKQENVQHILKGGEDSIGALEAIQRVYFNIGSCAEQCWMNHVPDIRALDPTRRNAAQSPFRIGQCRRDCASFRAIEDRLGDLASFFFAERPTDLWAARGLANRSALETQLDQEFGEGSVALGKQVFAKSCAECHSSQDEPYELADFHAVDSKDPTLRIDFLSSEHPIPVSRVGTFAGRAMHSNHMPGRIWDEYAARDLSKRMTVKEQPEIAKGAGRGYYRPPSLLSVWAHAPFMHNNAIGPELCGTPKDAGNLYSSPYVDKDGKPLTNPPDCWPFDPSVEGRYRLYQASMRALLWPETRVRKITFTDEDIVFDVAPDAQLGDLDISLSITVPKGTPVVKLNSLRFKDLVQDLIFHHRHPKRLESKYKDRITTDEFKVLKAGLDGFLRKLLKDKVMRRFSLNGDPLMFAQKFYSNVLEPQENKGHTFGETLSDREKNALIAFLATL
ncbi:MAG: cytochrome c [Pseudomonadota bacterium]